MSDKTNFCQGCKERQDEIERLQRRYKSDSEHIEQLQKLLARTKDKIRELRAALREIKEGEYTEETMKWMAEEALE